MTMVVYRKKSTLLPLPSVTRKHPSGERESGSYSGTRQRNRIQFRALVRAFVGVTQHDLETPSGDPGRVFFSV